MKRITVVLAAIAIVAAMATPAAGSTIATGFEPPAWTLGNPNQNGWSITPWVPSTGLSPDVGIVTPGIFGTQALRISNAYTDGAFGNWLFSPKVDPAGETAALSHFETTFSVASVTPAAQQPDLQFSLAPQSGQGDRMSFLRFEDRANGVHVIFFEAIGTTDSDAVTPGVQIAFVSTDIATLSRSAHQYRVTMDFVPGPSNDVVKVFIDGTLRVTGTSWENYYRFDSEQAGGNNKLPVVDSLIFQARSNGGTAPATLGAGFLVDDASIQTGVPVLAPTITGISPSSAAPGATVTLTGTNLSGGQVTVCGLAAVETSVSATQIKFTVPAAPVGTCPVVVTTPGGTASTSMTVLAAPTVVGRQVRLQVKFISEEKMRLKGKVTSSDAVCYRNVPVKLQRKKHGVWKTLMKDITNQQGKYGEPVKARDGYFRAVAPEHQVGNVVCQKAVSNVVHVVR